MAGTGTKRTNGASRSSRTTRKPAAKTADIGETAPLSAFSPERVKEPEPA